MGAFLWGSFFACGINDTFFFEGYHNLTLKKPWEGSNNLFFHQKLFFQNSGVKHQHFLVGANRPQRIAHLLRPFTREKIPQRVPTTLLSVGSLHVKVFHNLTDWGHQVLLFLTAFVVCEQPIVLLSETSTYLKKPKTTSKKHPKKTQPSLQQPGAHRTTNGQKNVPWKTPASGSHMNL